MFVGFICEADESKVTPQACLACAQKGAKPGCHFTPPIIRGILAFSGPRNLNGPSVTELLGCPRKLILRQRVDHWEKPSEAYWCFRGHLGHALVEDYHAADDDVLAEVRFEAQIDGLTVSGKPDALYYRGRGHLVDYKTTKRLPQTWKVYTCPGCGQVLREGQWAARRGTKLKCAACDEEYKASSIVRHEPPRPYGSHEAQLNLYAWLLDRNGLSVKSAEVLYLDMSGVLRVPVALWPPEQTEAFIRRRLEPLRPYYNGGPEPEALPAGVQDDEEQNWQCKYCPVVEACQEAGR